MILRRTTPFSRAADGSGCAGCGVGPGGFAWLAVLMMLGFSACATGDYAYVKKISTGERIQLALERGSPVLASKGTITIRQAALVPSPNVDTEKKQLQYLFAFEDKSGIPPRAVVVEDVSDEATILMVDQQDPKLVNGRWIATSRFFSAHEDAMVWIEYLGDSMRVYRFTITTGDGAKVVLDQGWMVPGWAKVPMRRALGLK